MKYLILFIINFSISLYSQNKVLENYDFENNNYSLVFFKNSGNKNYKISDSLDYFVISNKGKLNELKNNWVGEKSDRILVRNDFAYNIYLIDKDSILEGICVNLNGGFVSVGIHNYYFKGNPFKNLKPDKKIFINSFSTDDLLKARKIHNKIIATKGVYYPLKDYFDIINFDNINFDGKASISIIFDKSYTNKSEIKKEFDKRFSKENQFLDFSGYSENEYSGYLYCNESFFNKIVNEGFDWADFKVTIRTWNKNTKDYVASIFSEDEKLVKSFKIE